MNAAAARLPVLCAAALLAGCLEVEQNPPWSAGHYAGKEDPRHAQRHFHGDRLAWNARVIDRNRLQDEFLRTEPPQRQEPRR